MKVLLQGKKMEKLLKRVSGGRGTEPGKLIEFQGEKKKQGGRKVNNQEGRTQVWRERTWGKGGGKNETRWK